MASIHPSTSPSASVIRCDWRVTNMQPSTSTPPHLTFSTFIRTDAKSMLGLGLRPCLANKTYRTHLSSRTIHTRVYDNIPAQMHAQGLASPSVTRLEHSGHTNSVGNQKKRGKKKERKERRRRGEIHAVCGVGLSRGNDACIFSPSDSTRFATQNIISTRLTRGTGIQLRILVITTTHGATRD